MPDIGLPIEMDEGLLFKCKECTAVFFIQTQDNVAKFINFCPNCGSTSIKYK